jgi:hypothetical protein
MLFGADAPPWPKFVGERQILTQRRICCPARNDRYPPRLWENTAKFYDRSNRAKFFAIFSLPSGLKARKSEQNRSV